MHWYHQLIMKVYKVHYSYATLNVASPLLLHYHSGMFIAITCFVLSLSRYKLKFSPDKVDTMIVQAISLLDDLDKELNNYVMRAREWYGWHFPEMSKIVADNIAYVKVVKEIGKPLVFSCNAMHFRYQVT